MNFRTQIPITKQTNNLIDYQSKILLLGSCFSENIGAKFEYYKFQNTINPFGILFHPKAIETFLERVVKQNFYSEDDLVFHNERYHCFDAHSSLSNSNKEVLLSNLNTILKSTHQQITESTHLIITLGTAWVYEYIERKKVVANCHKIPQKDFHKKILSVDDVTNCLQNIEQLIKEVTPSTQLIYTVSPVRHIKDGFVANQQSKAHLLSAIHNVITIDPNNYLEKQSQHLSPRSQSRGISYFPSYEIMMDDLRDYRFYAEDMLHPNQTAIDYIWEQFQAVWFHETTKPVMKKVTVIQNGLAHRPFNPESELHQQFLKQLGVKKDALISDFPFMKF
ncbi:MAG: GSCFA domain-containing protein [Kordia sp.]|nr:MAG: GSCFA domain-containing protein [Kordia sp.]